MTLEHYFAVSADTAASLAARCGISTGSMSRIRKGAQNITLALARKIEAETGGAVTVADLRVPMERAA